MFERLTKVLVNKTWVAMVVTFGISCTPFPLGVLIAGLVTLRKKIVEGAILTLLTILPLLFSGYFTNDSSDPTMPGWFLWGVIGVGILGNLLTWIFALMLNRKATWGSILQVAALLGVLVISILHLIYPNITEWWGTQLQSFNQVVSDLIKGPQTTVTTTVTTANPQGDNLLDLVSAMKFYMTGYVTTIILLVALLQLIIARWWEAVIYGPKHLLRKELHNIKLSQLAGILFALSLVLSYLGNAVVLDIMPVLLMLFTAAGLSLLHYFSKQSSVGWLWLTLVYAAIIIPSSRMSSMILLALFALIDSSVDLRKRFKKVN